MLRRPLLLFACAALLAPRADATWSIVVVNRRTGEVAIGAATCIARTDLAARLPALVPGKGGGVVQAAGAIGDLVPLYDGLEQGLLPAEILTLVQDADPAPSQMQTGIVALASGAPASFTGVDCGRARGGVAGEVGDLAYAIQGNVLAGIEVVVEAEAALLAAPGDLGQKVLAAMQAARDFGGDGRCSCSLSRPASCGAPPDEFEKSAHVGFIIVARIGDPGSVCERGNDCAEGPYYMKLNVRGRDAQEGDPDPVDQLEERYAEWRANRAGRPDGILSTVDAVDALPADGLTKRVVTVRLVDVDGAPLDHGGASVRVDTARGNRSLASLSPVTDHGDGSYSFVITAGSRPGTDQLVITAADDLLTATLFPNLEIRLDPPAALHAGRDQLSAAAGGSVPFVLARPDHPGARYLILASASGSAPGLELGHGVLLPLVPDPLFSFSLARAGSPGFLPGTRGVLDERGRGAAEFRAPPGALAPLVGRDLSWAALVLDRGQLAATDPITLDVRP